MRICVTSKNPVKCESTQLGFARMFPNSEIEIIPVSVPSGVADQPMSSAETYAGALNRVTSARAEHADADYWIGLEAGLEMTDHGMEAFTWIVISDASGKIGQARSATFYLPPKVAELVLSGLELGDADDAVFGSANSKQKNGAVGLLTDNTITRTDYYTEAIIMALIPFKKPEYYPSHDRA